MIGNSSTGYPLDDWDPSPGRRHWRPLSDPHGRASQTRPLWMLTLVIMVWTLRNLAMQTGTQMRAAGQAIPAPQTPPNATEHCIPIPVAGFRCLRTCPHGSTCQRTDLHWGEDRHQFTCMRCLEEIEEELRLKAQLEGYVTEVDAFLADGKAEQKAKQWSI